MALQKARREWAMRKEGKPATGLDGQIFGGSMAAEAREAKRRKTAAAADDVFGPEL